MMADIAIREQRYQKLHIVGNGYDLRCGLRTRYADFGKFVRTVDEPFWNDLSWVFRDGLWSDFESALGELPSSELSRLPKTAATFGSPSFWDSEQERLLWESEARILSNLTEGGCCRLRGLLGRWIQSIDVNDAIDKGPIVDDASSLYFTFNYTMTLESLLHVPRERVLHVHGSAESGPLFFGHGGAPETLLRRPAGADYSGQAESEELRAEFILLTRKPVSDCLKRAEGFFTDLRDVTAVEVVGFSFSEVDSRYVGALARAMPGCRTWTVYVRDDGRGIDALGRAERQLGRSGVRIDPRYLY